MAAATRSERAERPAIETQRLTLQTDDGHGLAATLYLGRDEAGDPLPVRATVVVASAMGVPQGYYATFARHLARAGLVALTLDYRGIAASRSGGLRRSRVRLADWGEHDLRAAVDFLHNGWPDAPLTWIGHSVGGQLLGLAGDERIDRALLVAAQSGHWRLWQGADRLKMIALWYGVIPLLVPVAGRLPAKVLGGGEDLPPGVARQWAEWGRSRRYIEGYARKGARHGFADFRGAIRAYAFADDALAPRDAVAALLDGFDHASRSLVEVQPRDVGLEKIGHFGAFDRSARRALWPEFASWLAEGDAGLEPRAAH